MRVIFMGTPEFAVPGLVALAAIPDVTVVSVVTRRDQPVGRGRALSAPPVKAAALARNLPVLQPGSLRRPDAQALLADLAPDLIVVAAFGQILPAAVLALPRYGCLNVHASLLPRFRGASPISAAILTGDTATGVTIMHMDVGLDTGDIISQAIMPVAADDTTASLTAKLAHLGADLLVRTVPSWVAGAIIPVPQNETLATLTRLIRKEDGAIDWRHAADAIARQIRAYIPWPGAQTNWQGQPLKVIAAHHGALDESTPLATSEIPGTVIAWGRGNAMHVGVICGAASVLILDVIQLPGKKALAATDVARGQPGLVGARLPS